MKRRVLTLMLAGCLLAATAWGSAQQDTSPAKDDAPASVPTAQIANPWVGYETLEQALEASSLSLPTACLTLISYDGCSYAISAPTGYTGENAEAFLSAVFDE